MMAKMLDEAQRMDALVAASRVISTPISSATGSSETAMRPVVMKIANKGPVLFARTAQMRLNHAKATTGVNKREKNARWCVR